MNNSLDFKMVEETRFELWKFWHKTSSVASCNVCLLK